MSEIDNDPLVVAAAAGVAEEFKGVREELAQVNALAVKRDKKRRRSIGILTVSVIADVILTIVVGLLFNNVHQEQVNACHTSNYNRAIDKGVWDTVLNEFLVLNPNATAAQAKQTKVVIDGLEAKVAYAYRQQPC